MKMIVKGKKRKGEGKLWKKGVEKSGGREWKKGGVVWGICTNDPRMLYFRVDRESRDVDVAFLLGRRGS